MSPVSLEKVAPPAPPSLPNWALVVAVVVGTFGTAVWHDFLRPHQQVVLPVVFRLVVAARHLAHSLFVRSDLLPADWSGALGVIVGLAGAWLICMFAAIALRRSLGD